MQVTKLERLYKDRNRYRQFFNCPTAIGEWSKMTAVWDSIDNWAPSGRSSSPDHDPPEEMQAIHFSPSLDFLNFSDRLENINGYLPRLEEEWFQLE